MKLNISMDEMDRLIHVLQEENFRPLEKLLNQILAHQKENVMKYNLTNGPEGLVIEKARAEGAEKLLVDLKAHKEKLLNPKETKNVRRK